MIRQVGRRTRFRILIFSDTIASKQTPCFVWYNWAVVFCHLLATVGYTIAYLGRDNVVIPYTQSFLKWVCVDCDGPRYYKGENLTSAGDCGKIGGRGFNTSNGIYCIVPETDGIPMGCREDDTCGGIDLGWYIIIFHALSCVFQAAAGCLNYEETIRDGKTPLRFIEYAISATFMLICIAVLNGVTDLDLLLAIGVLTCCCQLCGLAVEYVDTIGVKFLLHFIGWLQVGFAYGFILSAFISSTDAGENVQPPDFVWVIVYALMGLYMSFGVVQLTELFCLAGWLENCCNCGSKDSYWCVNTKTAGRCNPVYKEIVYITLSLAAKLTLGALIFTNVMVS